MPLDGTNYETEVFSLAGLVAWLEKQNPETEYQYTDCGGCLLHQYFVASGINMPVGWGMGGSTWYDFNHHRSDLPEHFDGVSLRDPHTFGAALTRAKALL